jgi:hypothetical protein
MLLERRFMMFHPLRTSFKFHQALIVRGFRGLALWVGGFLGFLEQTEFNIVAFSSFLSLVAGLLLGEWEVANLRHGDQQPHATLMQTDSGARTVLLKQR